MSNDDARGVGVVLERGRPWGRTGVTTGGQRCPSGEVIDDCAKELRRGGVTGGASSGYVRDTGEEGRTGTSGGIYDCGGNRSSAYDASSSCEVNPNDSLMDS